MEGTEKNQAILDEEALIKQAGLGPAEASSALDDISQQQRAHFQWDKGWASH